MSETIENDIVKTEFVRNTILMKQFRKISGLCGTDFFIVPLKGISLLFTIYKDGYLRNVGDIDILVAPENLDAFTDKLKEAGYIYRSAKSPASRIKAKRKIDMIHTDPKYCDLDIHIDLITKKFFKESTGDFTSWAMTRLMQTDDPSVCLLSPVDEWLYLALHYCFHLFSGEKWLNDLMILQTNFSDEEMNELVEIANRFCLQRVVTAVRSCLIQKYGIDKIRIPFLYKNKSSIFNLLLRKPEIKFRHRLSDRIIAGYWEFLFIDETKAFLKAYRHLLFPYFSVFCSIYNSGSRIVFFLMYPVHILLIFLSSILFFPLFIHKYS